MTKVLNKYKDGIPKGSVYVGRPTKFGNPFIVGVHGERGQCVELFKQWVYTQPALLEAIRKELRGRDLVCFCAPKSCHADVLIEIANSTGNDMSKATFTIAQETVAALLKATDTTYKTTVTGIVNNEDGTATVFFKTADGKNVSAESTTTPTFGIGDVLNVSAEGLVTVVVKEEVKPKVATRASGSDGSRGIATAASMML